MNAHELLDQKYLTLTSLAADGLPVRTAVFFVPEEDSILVVVTAQQASAVTGCVTVSACSARGRLIGEESFAEVQILTSAETDRARARVIGRYGVVPRNLIAHRDDLVGLRLRLSPGHAGRMLRLAA